MTTNKPTSIRSWLFGGAYAPREVLLALAFLVPALLLVGVFMYYPMVRAFFESLYETSFLSPEPEFIGLKNYRDMLADSGFWQVVKNSLVWTIGVVLLQNVIGMAIAVLLNQDLPMRGLTRTLVVLPWVLPGIVAAILWRFMYDPQLGLINSILVSLGMIDSSIPWLAQPSTAMFAVIIAAVWKGYPFSTIIYLAALQTVDEEQLEAARDRWCQCLAAISPRGYPSHVSHNLPQPAAHHDLHLQLFRYGLDNDQGWSVEQNSHLPHHYFPDWFR